MTGGTSRRSPRPSPSGRHNQLTDSEVVERVCMICRLSESGNGYSDVHSMSASGRTGRGRREARGERRGARDEIQVDARRESGIKPMERKEEFPNNSRFKLYVPLS